MDESAPSSQNPEAKEPSTVKLTTPESGAAEPAANSGSAAGAAAGSVKMPENKTVMPAQTAPSSETAPAEANAGAGPPVSPLDIRLNESANLASTEKMAPDRPAMPFEYFQIGEMVGIYKIVRVVGEGGMGRVYEALDTVLDRPVAIKILTNQKAPEGDPAARFQKEARLMARLNHENIAQVYYCGTERGIPFIACEYVQGQNVRDYVRQNGVISVEDSVKYLHQVACALIHAASNGVTHRDIKPSNLIITPDDKIKVIDMGLAHVLRSDNPEDDLTVKDAPLGTPDYISPEQALDPRVADVRSDIYSLGCTFFFMLSGRPPYAGGTTVRKLLLHQKGDAPDIRELVPELPECIAAVIEKMMATDPEDRYQNPEEFDDALREAGLQLGIFTQGGPVPSEPVPKPEAVSPETASGPYSRWLAYNLPWVIASVILIAAAAVVWMLGEKKDDAFISNLRQTLQNSPFLASPVSEQPKPEPGPAVRSVALSPYYLGTRRKEPGFVFGEAIRPEEMGGGFDLPPREFGGIGTVPFSSNGILSAVDTSAFADKAVQLLETTVDPQSDTWTWGWSSVLKSGDAKTERPYVKTDSVFREGIDPIVDGKGMKDGCFATLDDAVAGFVEWNRSVPPPQRREVTIHLAFDGEMTVSQHTLTDCSLRLLPATGFLPRLVFRPRSAFEGGAMSLFTLQNSRLAISNISLFLDVTGQNIISDSWTMIRFDIRSALNLENVGMSIRNCGDDGSVFHPNTAFFRLTDSSFRSSAAAVLSPEKPNNTDAEKAPEQEGGLILSRGVYQGEAALLAVPAFRPLNADVRRAVLVIDGPLVTCEDRREGQASEPRKCRLFLQESFVWSRSPLFRIVRLLSPSRTGRVGDEISSAFNRSFFVLGGNPIGEFILPVSAAAEEVLPDWKITESLLADVSGKIRLTRQSGQSGETGSPAVTVPADFDTDNIVFAIVPLNSSFWNITRDEAESAVFDPARKNIESEIGSQWLESLVTALKPDK